jgi:hypothetical protein
MPMSEPQKSIFNLIRPRSLSGRGGRADEIAPRAAQGARCAHYIMFERAGWRAGVINGIA